MATVELFSFLGYDQSKKSEILDFLKKKTGKNIPVKRLNELLEKGEVVEYFNDALTQVDDANKAKYCIIDTGYPSILLTDDGTICVELIRLRNTWTGGFVDLKENLLATNREKERSYGAKSNLSNEIAVAVQEAVHNGATQEKLDEVVAKVKENSEHSASLSNVVSSKLVNTIKDYMLNFGDGWNDASIKQVVGGVLMVAHAELQQGRDTGWLKLNVMKNSVIINSGFIGDDYDYIYLVGDVDANSYITNVNVLDSSAKMIQLGFKDTELPSEILCSKMIGCFELPFTDVSTDDRSKMRHCIIERAYRSESSLKSMTVREIRDRIRLSIEMSLSLQKRGVCMVEPIYYIKNQCVSYCIPFYAKADMDISKPDGILLVKEIDGIYKVCTMLDTYSAFNGVVTLDRYPQAAWLKDMVGTDVLKREIKMEHITEEDEA